MEWETGLKQLWQDMTFDRAKEIYTPVLVRALSNLCPEKMSREDAEDIIVAITSETFKGVEKVFRFLPQEIGFLEEMTRLATTIAMEMQFTDLHVSVLEWFVIEARFEQILAELGHKIVMASSDDMPKLLLARKRVMELYEQWRIGSSGTPPKPDEEPPGNAPLGARPRPPVFPVAPAIGRTVYEAKEPPRNP